MRTTVQRCVMLMVGLFGGSGLCRADGGQQPARLDTQVRVTFDYLLYLPDGYEKQESWPLMLFLHGAGERGNDLQLIKRHGPPKLIEEGKKFPFVVVSPQCPLDRWWTTETTALTALLDDVMAKHKIDPDRVYLTGLSMGGFGTWMLAGYSPQRFAAIVPICGGGEVLATRRLTNLPAWVFHGAKDPLVPLKRSEDMVEGMKKAKGEVKFTVYPEALHDSWSATYENPEVYEWLLAQKRKPAPKTEP